MGRAEPLAGVAGKGLGKGTIAGTSADGVHSSITDELTLTFPPKKTT